MSNLTVTTLTNQDVQLSKAWVNFNGTGTVAIRSSYNVSSITDVDVGDYTVNFTNNMTDANYGVQVSSNRNDASGTVVCGFYTSTVSAVTVALSDTSGADVDCLSISVSILSN
jgi:hypothetical protein